MSPVQMTVVDKVIENAEVIHGARIDSNTTFPGSVLENSRHTTIIAVVVPRTMMAGRMIMGQRLFQTI